MSLLRTDDMICQVQKAEENGKRASEEEKKEEEEKRKNDSPKSEELSLQSKSASEGEKNEEDEKRKNDSPKSEELSLQSKSASEGEKKEEEEKRKTDSPKSEELSLQSKSSSEGEKKEEEEKRKTGSHKSEEMSLQSESAFEGEKKEEEEKSKNDSTKSEYMSLQSAFEGEKKEEEEKSKNDSTKSEYMSLQSTNDDLNVRIKELQEKLESEKAKQRDLKKQMRENKEKANKETFQWKCKYEALLTERKGSQEDTSNEDPIQIGKVQSKIVNVPDDEKKAVNKKSSKLPKMVIEEDGDENQECIVRHGNEVRETEDRMRKNDEETTIMEQEKNHLKEEIKELRQRMMKNDAKKADMKEENKRLKKENEELRQRISTLENSVNEKANLQKQFTLERQKTEDLSEKVKIKNDKITSIEHEIHRLKEEDDTLRMRLSEIAGTLLINRNPVIADLSDVTRPTKLAEIFSELYDNQWTDAFEEQTGSEQEVIKLLLRFLTNIHTKCQKLSSEYMSELEEKIIVIPGSGTAIFTKKAEIPATTRKFLVEIRKSVSEQIIHVLITHFRKKFILKEKKSRNKMKATAIFIDKCIELCWYMAIKDPPVTLGDIPKEGEPVNKELFRSYTRSGKYVDYCVWPPLLLCEDGALLCKGIIQGK